MHTYHTSHVSHTSHISHLTHITYLTHHTSHISHLTCITPHTYHISHMYHTPHTSHISHTSHVSHTSHIAHLHTECSTRAVSNTNVCIPFTGNSQLYQQLWTVPAVHRSAYRDQLPVGVHATSVHILPDHQEGQRTCRGH